MGLNRLLMVAATAVLIVQAPDALAQTASQGGDPAISAFGDRNNHVLAIGQVAD